MMRVVSECSFVGLGRDSLISGLGTRQTQQQQQKSNANNVMYPCNPSLQDELNRLFLNYCLGQNAWSQVDDVREEFKHNGRDYEYCSDTEEQVITPRSSKKKNKKPLPTECVFCKNNGEDVKIYKKHVLKSPEGRVECPILRKYVCPICSATGDAAHTIKYCPSNKKQQMQPLASMNTLKALRNSTGRRRSNSRRISSSDPQEKRFIEEGEH